MKAYEQKLKQKASAIESKDQEIDKLEAAISQMRREQRESRDMLIEMTAKYNAAISR